MKLPEQIVNYAAAFLEFTGIAAIVLGAVFSIVMGMINYFQKTPGTYIRSRQRLSRAILLGLEFLVAADIIKTVAIEPSFTSVGVLGVIVIIRTFLSFTLEVEISGKWPWQKKE